MSPGEAVDLALARVASAAEDVIAGAGERRYGWVPVDADPMTRLRDALEALQVARKAYRESYPERRAP